MSLTKIGEQKYCIVRRGKFWSGTGWTTWYEFSLHFDFSSALNMIEKRFHRMTPLPKIDRCSKYERQKKKKEQKKLKQKRLSQKKFEKKESKNGC